jgi:hypothetical protein
LIDKETAQTKVSEWKRVVFCLRQDAEVPSQVPRPAILSPRRSHRIHVFQAGDGIQIHTVWQGRRMLGKLKRDWG